MSYRFSGHETFPCRYAWLPKAYRAVETTPSPLAEDEQAMIELGVGKNMVRAIRFWVQVAGVAASRDGILETTDFGRAVFAGDGFDPFLEDVRTLWLIHWTIATQKDEPLFAWDFLLNRWQSPEIERTAVLRAFQREAERLERPLSPVTIEQHFDTFLHTYVPTRGRKGEIQEDNLDCPLVELELIQKVGERRVDGSGRREPVYAFRREEKPEITPELFVYCLDDFWRQRHPEEKTLSFREITVGHGSTGQVFKLPEAEVRNRLETIGEDSGGAFEFRESASLRDIIRLRDLNRDLLLSKIYSGKDALEASHANR
jgi:hypothetical protein